jgi:MFS family permease
MASRTLSNSPRATYGSVFSVREFRALYVAHVASMLGDVVAAVALTVLVFERTGSSLLAALTFSLVFVPYLVGGVLLSALVDRLPPRPTLVACHLASAALVAVMAIPGMPIWALLALLVALGLIAPVFSGVRAAILPDLLPDRSQYVLGRALMRMVAQGSQVFGNALGGALLLLLHPGGALVVDAVSFALSALLVQLGTRSRPAATGAAEVSVVRDSLAGMRAVLAHRPVRRLLLLGWLLPACAVAPEALAAPYVRLLGEPVGAVGLLLAAMPAGTVVADLAGGRLLGPVGQRRLLVPAALLICLPLVAFAIEPELPLALGLLALTGLGFAYGLALDRMVLDAAPERLRARVLALEGPVLMFAQGAAFAVWGALGEVIPLPLVVAAAGGCGLLGVAWLRPPRAAASP